MIHPNLGEVPLLRYFVNIRQSTSGGDHTLLRAVLRVSIPSGLFERALARAFSGVY